jgi:hypothetical protein
MLKVRCSALGAIMTNPRSKTETLSETTKTYVKEMVLEHKYGIRKEFTSKYTDKGLQCEDEAITLVNDVLGLGFIFKNEEHFNNEWITGTPDVNTNEILLDVKCSYEAHTFPFFEDKIPNKGYYYQLMGYMWLTGKTESLLCYCLVNTPIEIVEDEVRREHWKHFKIDEDLEIREFVEKKHNFDHIPNTSKVKVFKIERDETVIWEIQKRIEEVRIYFNQLIETI